MKQESDFNLWRRNCLVLMFSLGVAEAAFGQAVVDRAISLGQDGNWTDALEVLLPQMTSTALQSEAHAWYVLGFIQKELYKTTEAQDLESPRRMEAVFSLQRAADLNPTKEDVPLITAALDFLARSYLRDAIDRVDGFTAGEDDVVLATFGRYEAIVKSIDSNEDISVQKADVYRYLAQANGQLLAGLNSRNRDLEKQLFDRSVDHYKNALKLVPGNYAGLYNLAITLYNQGVRQLKRINHETSMFELMEIQDACVVLFEQSLSPMKLAHDLQPERFEPLKGLMTIHYALNEQEASDFYRKKIDGLKPKRP